MVYTANKINFAEFGIEQGRNTYNNNVNIQKIREGYEVFLKGVSALL